MIFKHFSLRATIFITLALLVLIALSGAAFTVWAMRRVEALLQSAIDSSVAALTIAEELETSLTLQKGLLTYFFLDNDPEWLKQLDQHRRDFESWMKKARETSKDEKQYGILHEIESGYIRYSYGRDRVVSMYLEGEREAGLKLHREIRSQFFAIRELCERYKELHAREIARAREDIHSRFRSLSTLAWLAVIASLFVGLVLASILLTRVLDPIRRLAQAGKSQGDPPGRTPDEVQALSRRVASLMEDVDQTQTQLQLSREHLVQTEKLAMVGKLAAGVAHSIRNPLTSVKMRLFSMQRSLDLDVTQREDFDVISEEIRHIDAIVRNFLEFSRPPKLKIQNISLSDVVDMAIQLLRHRIESYGVGVELYRQRRLPEIEGDPEQLKEVFVNLLVNACEAMPDGGRIIIREEEGVARPLGNVVVVRVIDNGPGIPEPICEKVFQPFFSTKEEGTGLGLSIATRIIEDHRGVMHVRSREGKGTTFTITLPYRGEEHVWLRS